MSLLKQEGMLLVSWNAPLSSTRTDRPAVRRSRARGGRRASHQPAESSVNWRAATAGNGDAEDHVGERPTPLLALPSPLVEFRQTPSRGTGGGGRSERSRSRPPRFDADARRASAFRSTLERHDSTLRRTTRDLVEPS